MKKANSTTGNTEQVDEFMDKLDHPFKAEVQMIREIIKKVNKEITEQIKWNAPSFSYKGESLVTFNLWENSSCVSQPDDIESEEQIVGRGLRSQKDGLFCR